MTTKPIAKTPTKPVTKVEISFFKPTGFEDTHWIDTDDRGGAARYVLSLYGMEPIKLNYIMAKTVGIAVDDKRIKPFPPEYATTPKT